MSTDEIDSLLEKVNMSNSFLQMSTEDQEGIIKMKQVIKYQISVSDRREKLLEAIVNNVKYLATLSDFNAEELRQTKVRLMTTLENNQVLRNQNNELNILAVKLMKDQKLLDEKRQEIAKLVAIDQKNKATIEKLNIENDNKTDNMEKLNIEITVVVAEKISLKKEYDSLTMDFRRLKLDYNEQRETYNVIVDEMGKLSSQNAEYRGLILDNEKRVSMLGDEISDINKMMERKNTTINRSN